MTPSHCRRHAGSPVRQFALAVRRPCLVVGRSRVGVEVLADQQYPRLADDRLRTAPGPAGRSAPTAARRRRRRAASRSRTRRRRPPRCVAERFESIGEVGHESVLTSASSKSQSRMVSDLRSVAPRPDGRLEEPTHRSAGATTFTTNSTTWWVPTGWRAPPVLRPRRPSLIPSRIDGDSSWASPAAADRRAEPIAARTRPTSPYVLG